MVFRVAVIFILAFAGVSSGAWAQTAKPVSIDGFRAAKFGMSEIETLSAIKADFALSNNAVTQTSNPVTGTHLFKITVKNLLPKSGQGTVTYSFGYASDRLDEIDVTWDAKDAGNSPAGLLQTGAVLQNYFLAEVFPPGHVTGSALLTNGNLLLFRGSDDHGHAVALFISGPETHDATSNKTNITPAELTVAYAADPSHPDVFKVPAGSF